MWRFYKNSFVVENKMAGIFDITFGFNKQNQEENAHSQHHRHLIFTKKESGGSREDFGAKCNALPDSLSREALVGYHACVPASSRPNNIWIGWLFDASARPSVCTPTAIFILNKRV
jgi:hypothetical protein